MNKKKKKKKRFPARSWRITWVVHVVHPALVGEPLVSNAPFCCGETWLALVNRLQHTPLSAQVSSQALCFLSPRATLSATQGEKPRQQAILSPSSASPSQKLLWLWGSSADCTASLCRTAALPGALLQSAPNTNESEEEDGKSNFLLFSSSLCFFFFFFFFFFLPSKLSE